MISSKQEVIDAKVRLAEAQAKRIKELEADNAALLREAPRGWLERAAYERRDGNETKAITALRLGLESAASDLAVCCLDLAGHHLAFLDHELPPHLPEAERHAKLAILLAPDDRRARAMLEEIVEIKAMMGSTASDSTDVIEAEDLFEPEPGMDAGETVYALCQASDRAIEAGCYRRAERLARRAVLIGKCHLGETASLTLSARYYRAYALTFAGEGFEALAEVKTLLPLRERVLGAEHRAVLATRLLHVQVLNNLGQDKEALKEMKTLRSTYERVLDINHPGVLATRRQYVQLLIDLGSHKMALVEIETLLPTYEQTLGLEHSEVFVVRHLHAQVLNCLDQYEEALKEVKILQSVRGRVLGAEHPNVLVTRSLHAQVLNNMKRHKEALAEVEALRPVQERIQGAEHPNTLWTQWLHGRILFNLGCVGEAAELLEDTLQKQKKRLPDDHPHVLQTQEELRKIAIIN